MDFKNTLTLLGSDVLTATTGYTRTHLSTSGQSSVHWGNLTSTPTTLAGYGIAATDVTAQALTGYAVGTNAVLTTTDSILAAFGKVQAQLNAKQASADILGASQGGTGVNNGTNTLTVPAPGTAALLGTAQTFTATQTITRSGATPLDIRGQSDAIGRISLRLSGEASGFGTYIQFTDNDTYNMALGANAGGDLAFYDTRYPTAAGTHRFSVGRTTGTANITGGLNVGSATGAAAGELHIAGTAQARYPLKFSGQESYQAGHTSTDGIAFDLAVNRAGNRQLYLRDTGAAVNDITGLLRMMWIGGGVSLGVISTNYSESLPLTIDSPLYIGTALALHAGNYTSYAPTLTGSGASGTWGIRITGLAGGIASGDAIARNAATILPTTAGQRGRFDFVEASSAGTGGNYAGLLTYAPWDGTSSSTGDASYQLAFGSTAINGGGIPMLNVRKGIDSTWNSWYTLLHSGNYSGYALPLSGGTVSGGLTITGVVTGTSSSSLVVQRNGNTAAWWGRLLVQNATSDKAVFLGTYGTICGVFAHNNALTAWDDLYVNTVDGSAGGAVRLPTSTYVNGSLALHAGNVGTYALGLASGSYYQASTWIQFNTAFGLYWPGQYGTHIYPSVGNYGAFTMTGSRGGWSGINFNSCANGTVTLMCATGSNASGFYNEIYGWQTYWESGTLYVGKGTYGGGEAAVLDATNYSRYALPLSGGATTGNVGINRGAWTGAALYVKGPGATASTYGLVVQNSNGTNVFYINDGGTAFVWNNPVTYSDARLKTEIAPISGALATVCAIPARQWRWKTEPDGPLRYGPIAQETEVVAPELVLEGSPGPGEELIEGERPLLSLRGDSLVGLLLGAVQELAVRVIALEEKTK